MRGTRRLARLEASLSPRQATLLWLAEAHRFGSLAAYASSLVDQPASMLPLVAVPQQARRAARAALRGQPRSVIAEAEQEAFHEALFLVQLVIELDRAARTTLERAELRWLALWSEQRTAKIEGVVRSEPPSTWHRALDDLSVTVTGAQEACSLLERRHLDGRDAVFPETLAAWQELREALHLRARSHRSRASVAVVKPRATTEAAAIAESTRAACLALVGESGEAVALVRSARHPGTSNTEATSGS